MLTKDAMQTGNPSRGAFLFYQPVLGCAKCHSTGDKPSPLGPDLTEIDAKKIGEHIVESLLQPSKIIKKGFETVAAVTSKGVSITGLLVRDDGKQIVLRNTDGKEITLNKADLTVVGKSKTSLMPAGLVNQLHNRQQFLDLVRFVMEVTKGGPPRAEELRPPPSFFALPPLPDYEKKLDHAGLISAWNRKSFERGKAIYHRVCANCHGTKDKPGSLPTSLRFAEGTFKNGSDPFNMYQTLTHGYGMMIAQRELVPIQKYDVIHYIREAYLKPHNPSQHTPVNAAYLAKLPRGDTFGPKPSNVEPWVAMNYGPHLTATYEIGDDASNFAYTGIAVRLDAGPGGVSRGRQWLVYDHDTFRVAAVWTGKELMDYNGIAFNGRHAVHPRILGDVQLANPNGPGWANPENGSFKDMRLVGRDGRRYGPLPRSWTKYRGIYHFGDRVIISYLLGKTPILEMPNLMSTSPHAVYARSFHIGPRDKDLIMQVAHQENAKLSTRRIGDETIVVFGDSKKSAPVAKSKWSLDGKTYFEIANGKAFDMRDRDYTIYAKIKTRKGGSIFCKTEKATKWVRDGTTFFVRGGRLAFDIGWVGVVTSKQRVNDGKWHDVAMTYEAKNGMVRLFIDGKLDQTGRLKPKKKTPDHIVRLGFTAPNFPRPQSFFDGDIAEVRFYQERFSTEVIAKLETRKNAKSLIGHWKFNGNGKKLADVSGKKHHAQLHQGDSTPNPSGILVAGLAGVDQRPNDVEWLDDGKGNLRLRIPAGKDTLQFGLWFARIPSRNALSDLAENLPSFEVANLASLTQGGPPRWPQRITTKATLGTDDGPFAVDVLTRPAKNPWACRMRFTGFDFFPDGKRMAVCTWDGSVFLVDGVDSPEKGMVWQRIASGLFQPLGLKIVEGKIYVGCRDQIVILRDLNGDGETDFYENFNSDHQVTDHFHEFAMGLQTDADGNFYYARAARHALKALVPHHGTLIRVSKDGKKSEILATGFRAPNGVCVNPDGTFIVTDQEGHWNPKNRINWVKTGGFYGNMYGYHNVKDSSDDAMEKPLCWITNKFDRSPAELMWVNSKKWGPLHGSLLNFSYGNGKIFIVPHEKVGDVMQGGMCPLPIPLFPTGVMRGRFHPVNGQLYTCGMFAWGGNQHQPGGIYRVRYNGKPIYLPLGLKANKNRIEIRFSDKLDREFVKNGAKVDVRAWDLKRSANYGSKHYNERALKVTGLSLADDGKTLSIMIPDLHPTRGMEIRYSLRGHNGEPVRNVIHNTIHQLGK